MTWASRFGSSPSGRSCAVNAAKAIAASGVDFDGVQAAIPVGGQNQAAVGGQRFIKPLILIGTATCGRSAGALATWRVFEEETKELGIEVEIVEVREPTKEETEHGHAHGPGSGHDHSHE